MTALLLAAAIASCTQPVELHGDAALRAELRTQLGRRGVELGAGSDTCPALQVRVEREQDGIVLESADAAGRMQRRTVHEPRFAAALIESWRSSDLAAPLLDVPTPAAMAPAPTIRGPLAFTVAAELGYNDAGNWERGAAARLGAGRGWLLPELTLRFAEGHHPGTTLAPIDHWLADVLVGARLPFSLGPFTFAPGLAVGIGLDGSRRASCDASCPRIIEDDASATALAARAEASLVTALVLGSAFTLDGTIGGSTSAFDSGEPALPDYAAAAGAHAFALEAPPRARVRAGLGLTWRPR